MLDDPKDREEEPELGLEEETEEQEDEEAPETPEAESDEVEEEAEPEEAEDADLPDDPKTLKRMVRQAQLQAQHANETLRQSLRREPPTREAEPDELETTLAELETDPAKGATKALALILRREKAREERSVREARVSEALGQIPEKHRADVSAITRKFNLPVTVAHAIYKGALYDRAMERKRSRTKEAEAAEPSRPQGKAPQTRPVRRTAEPANGAGYIVVEGLKIKAKQKPGEYSALLDSLTPEKRRKVYAARKAGKISVE